MQDVPPSDRDMVDQDLFDEGEFDRALARLPTGYSEGRFDNRRWSATLKRDVADKRIWLFAEDLAGTDIVSFNLYRLSSGRLSLKPCEMSTGKVVAFVLGYRPD